jgi:glycosyltransferase involved in cell wall biosynthesis
MSRAIAELETLKDGNRVRLVGGPLSSESYQALLESADLVLVPYDAATYRSRTSGPFVEAICADKPVVIPSQSWMSAQFGKIRAGETFESGNGKDLVRAVVTTLENLPAYARAAALLGAEFRAYHNPETFVAHLVAGPASHFSSPDSAGG